MMNKLVLGAAVVAFGALSTPAAFAQDMTVTSAEVSEGSAIKDAQVANVFGCKGGNISPSLSWSGAPSDTRSFAITVYDPDAPTGSGLLALGRVQHSGFDHVGRAERWRREKEADA